MADGTLHPEIRRIVREPPSPAAEEVAATARDHASSCVDAVAELLACFPVYRSYLPEGRAAPRRRRSPTRAAAGPT